MLSNGGTQLVAMVNRTITNHGSNNFYPRRKWERKSRYLAFEIVAVPFGLVMELLIVFILKFGVAGVA